MTDIRPGANTQGQFFSPSNEAMLERILNTDFQRRMGTELSDKQQVRLQKTVRHYMTEVYSKNAQQPVQYLNKEVLMSVVPDYMSYLQRSQGPTIAEDGNVADPLRSDVNSRFDRLQNERMGAGAAAPAAPDFRISLEEDGPTPLSRFEEVKRMREAEAAREAAAVGTSQDLVVVPRQRGDATMGEFVGADKEFRAGFDEARARDQLSLIMRDEARAAGRAALPGVNEDALPDPRRVLLGDRAMIPLPPKAAGNPTTAVPEAVRERPILPQDVLRPQDDVMSYKETEHNLFIYSADRDWVRNNTENRYNFSVNFDPANNRPGFGYSPATNIKFKNITRIEFVKAIMPVETCDILPAYTGSSPTFSTALSPNVFSYPYLQVRIPELNTNGFGTNDGMNNAFAAISYDAYWAPDTNMAGGTARGWTRMIPKFLKCQKVYSPTPLATLTKLSFEIQRPDGTVVCDSKDTLDIDYVLMPPSTATPATTYIGSGTSTYEWIWLRTSTWFNRFSFLQGDRIIIKNIALNATLAASPGAAQFLNFLTRPEGHIISDIGQATGASNGYTVGVNSVGFANALIIKNDFNDPTTGLTTVKSYITTATTGIGPVINGGSVPAQAAVSSGRTLNMSHQVQIIMRVITRDMDAAARLRPDNLQA